jgi:hypothetical protein
VVVHEEERFGLPAERLKGAGDGKLDALLARFVPVLEQAGAALDRPARDFQGVALAGNLGVEDQVEAAQPGL